MYTCGKKKILKPFLHATFVNEMRKLGYIFLGLLLGILLFWVGSIQLGNQTVSTSDTNTIVTKLEKVFKIVSAEGHFNEVYNYKQTKEYFRFIPSTKKALLMIKAKVLMGYDFKNIKYEIDEKNKTVRISNLGFPEILSVDPTYNYYNIDDGLLNKFDPKELSDLQEEGKKQIIKAAYQSELPKMAQDQLQLLLKEFFVPSGWKIETNKPQIIINKWIND
jgi:hypothetical protein